MHSVLQTVAQNKQDGRYFFLGGVKYGEWPDYDDDLCRWIWILESGLTDGVGTYYVQPVGKPSHTG